MALRIVECCVNCSACEPLCPSVAIHAATPYFVIDPAACDECLGHYDDPQCASICPIEGAIVDEMNLPLNPPGSLTGITPEMRAGFCALTAAHQEQHRSNDGCRGVL